MSRRNDDRLFQLVLGGVQLRLQARDRRVGAADFRGVGKPRVFLCSRCRRHGLPGRFQIAGKGVQSCLGDHVRLKQLLLPLVVLLGKLELSVLLSVVF